MIDYQLAKALFNYCPKTGALTWRITTGSFKVGQEAGTVARNEDYCSYRNVSIFNERYKAHRIAWLLQTGSWPEKYIDHIDGDGLNNKWENLRQVSPSQNLVNQKVRSDSASGIKGVSYNKRRSAWQAYINLGRKRKHLGYHETLEEAAAARLAAQQRFHGEFSRKVS